MKGSEAQKQRPHELLWMLWFDEKSISSEHTYLPVLLFYETADSGNLVLFNDFCCLLCVAGGRKIYFHELPMRYYAFYFLFRYY